MSPKTPVLLLMLVETVRLRWFVASLGLDGRAAPLLRSEVGDLEKIYRLDFDEQVAFLRHRFCGTVQRGCDRLWARTEKACRFVFVFDGPLPAPGGELTQAAADHFVQWMLNPPVAVLTAQGGFDAAGPPLLEKMAGDLDAGQEGLLPAAVGALLAQREDETAWELVRKKPA
jgi:hypothetical protein